MTTQRFFLFFLVALSLSLSAQGRIFATIDTFATLAPIVEFEIPGGLPTTDYWYSPYDTVREPIVSFQDTTDALGGQRDIVCGYHTTSDPGSSFNVSTQPSEGKILISLSLGYIGTCYIQWDGKDVAGGTTAAFPGAVLNSSPGIGSENNPDANPDGQSMDFTFGGFATAITSTVTTDHDAVYSYRVLDKSGQENVLEFAPTSDETEFNFAAYFDSTRWTNPNFDWTQVVAFQVKVTAGNQAGTSSAIDTDFRFFRIIGYEVRGDVVVDCGCTGTPSSFSQGATLSLTTAADPNTVIATATTDSLGVWQFTNLRDGSYRVCLTSPATICQSSSQCQTFDLSGFIDPPVMRISTTVATTLVIPADEILNCGDCIDESCLGSASETGCNNPPPPVPTRNDNQDPCNRVITRTWTTSDGSITRTQTITVRDTSAPSITQQAISEQSDCGAGGSNINEWVAANGRALATDCNAITWTNDFGSAPSCGAVTVTFTATDSCGLASRTTATYTINDSTPPTFQTPPSSSSVVCDTQANSVQTAYQQWLSSNAGATAVDACTATTITNNGPSSIPNTCGSQDVTFTARDACGNMVPATATFTVVDTQAPVINPQAADQTVECATGGVQTAIQSWVSSRGGAQATDNCAASSQLRWENNWDGTSVPQGCSGSIPVTFTVTDPCGNFQTTTAQFFVSDTTPPVITRQASPAGAQCSSGDGSVNSAFQDWINNNGGAQATDACSSFSWSNDASTAPTDSCTDGITVTFTVRDDCNGLTASTTAVFSVQDSTPPTVIQAPQSTTADCQTDVNSQFQNWLNTAGGGQGQDNCGTTTWTHDFTGTGPSLGCNTPTVVRFTLRDLCTLTTGPFTATFTVTDNTPPTVTPATPLTVQCGPDAQTQYQSWLSSNGGATGFDSCSPDLQWSHNGPATLSQVCNSVQTVVFTVRDSCGLTATTSSTVTVVDNQPPTLTNPASNGQAECGTSDAQFNSWLQSNAGAQATDNCGGVSWVNDFTPNSWVDQQCSRVAVVTFTVSDSCGNSINQVAEYRLDNTQPPTITRQATPGSASCGSGADSTLNDYLMNHGGALATDACTPADQLVWTYTTDGSLPTGCGQIPVTFTVSDPCGGSASTSSTFTVTDTSRPTWTVPPSSPSEECDGAGNVAAYQSWVSSNGGAVAEDNCAFSVTVTNNAPAAGPVGCGSIPVVFTAVDDCGNSATITATFTVVDTIAPVMTPAFDNQVECDRAVNDQQLQDWLASHGGASASDSCYSADQLRWSNDFTSLSSDPCDRSATVRFTASDPCGQQASVTASFRIVDTTPPVVDQPDALILECGPSNAQEIQEYINRRGGATAVDSCTEVSWTLESAEDPVACDAPAPIIWELVDQCGNCASAYGSVVLVDNTAPEFVNFPPDIIIPCNEATDPSVAGHPLARDNCWSDVDLDLGYTDTQVQEPTYRFCPGDIIITRVWVLIDPCGNMVSREQIVIHEIARRVGPCIPEPCPPCETVCCLEQTNTIECNPVPCNPVECNAVPCETVPCVPQNCDGVEGGECEPVYIYVFNDDDDNTISAPDYFDRSSAGVLGISFISLLIIALSVLF